MGAAFVILERRNDDTSKVAYRKKVDPLFELLMIPLCRAVPIFWNLRDFIDFGNPSWKSV